MTLHLLKFYSLTHFLSGMSDWQIWAKFLYLSVNSRIEVSSAQPGSFRALSLGRWIGLEWGRVSNYTTTTTILLSIISCLHQKMMNPSTFNATTKHNLIVVEVGGYNYKQGREGASNAPLLDNHHSLLFLPVTPLSRFWTFEEIFELTKHPSMALNWTSN